MRRRNVLIVAGAVVALLIPGIVAVAVVNREHTPEQAVRDYVTLIAQGDAADANALVDPRGHQGGGEVDPARLANGLRSAAFLITIDKIETERHLPNQSVETVAVRVDYSLPGSRGDATLRVQRAPDRYGLLTRWRVIDPLLVSVAVQTDVPTFDTAHLGAAEVPATGPVTGPDQEPFPLRPVLLYPAEYELRGRPSTSLDFQPTRGTVVSTQSETRPLTLQVEYQPSLALRQVVLDRTTEYVNACVAAGASMAPNCPRDLHNFADVAKHLAVIDPPGPGTFGRQRISFHADGTTEPAFYFQSHSMRFTFTMHGQPYTQVMYVDGQVDISRDDTVTVSFTRSL